MQTKRSIGEQSIPIGPKKETLLHHACFTGSHQDEEGDTPLHVAALKGHVQVVDFLLQQNECDVTIPDSNGHLALHCACQSGSLSMVTSLVKVDPSTANTQNKEGTTPLQMASFSGHLDIVKYLASLGDDVVKPGTPDRNGRTAFHCACQEGHTQIGHFLIEECHLDCMAEDSKMQVTPLHLAARNGHLDLVKLICSQPSTKPDTGDKRDRTALHYACLRDHVAVVQYLIDEHHCDPTLKDNNGISPIELATMSGDKVMAWLQKSNLLPSSAQDSLSSSAAPSLMVHKMILDNDLATLKSLIGAFPQRAHNAEGLQGATPLHIACACDNLEIAKYLITECHVDCNVADQDGRTPLHLAAHDGYTNLVRFLASQQCNLYPKDKFGRIPLHYSSQNGHISTVEVLVKEFQCDCSIVDQNGITPANLAAECGHLNVMRFLVSVGKADPMLKDKNLRTPLHYASQGNHLNIVKYLVDECKCKSLSGRAESGTVTPLHLAAENGHMELVKFLCSQPDTVPDLQDKHGRTSLHYACQERHLAIVKYLMLEHNCNPAQEDSKRVTPLNLALVKGWNEIAEFIKSHSQVDSSSKESTGKPHDWFLNSTNLSDNLAIRSLAVKGDLEGLKKLLTDKDRSIVLENGPQGEKVLHDACYAGKLAVAEYLVNECPCELNSRDEEGHTALHNAAHQGHGDVVKFLLSFNECDIEVPDENGRIPVHFAAQNGHGNVVSLLMDAGSSIVIGDEKGITPVHLAAFSGHVHILKLLMSRENVTPQLVDSNGRTPLHCASQEGHIEAIRYLLENGADCLAKDKAHSVTCLHLAANNGHVDIMELLCSQPSCQPGAPDKHGRTPLHYASLSGHLRAVKCCSPFVVAVVSRHTL